MNEGNGRREPGLLDLLSRLIMGRRKVTEEEIQDLIDAGEEEGLINEEENEMIQAIFSLRDRMVREIMVPRTDMACVAVEAPIEEILHTIISCGHSRIPVFEGTVDNIVGLVYAKDLLRYWGERDGTVSVRQIMRQPFFIPETKVFEELLQEFKRRRVHIAIVIDEYGGTSGLVTIEDLLEQIVGDIQDEYDLEEEWLVENPDGSAVVDARLPIEELEAHFDTKIEREKFDTVAGFIYHLIGRIPPVGEEIEGDHLTMTILDAEERKINKVHIRKRSAVAEEAED